MAAIRRALELLAKQTPRQSATGDTRAFDVDSSAHQLPHYRDREKIHVVGPNDSPGSSVRSLDTELCMTCLSLCS